MNRDPEKSVQGFSPLGGNAVEGTTDADAEVRDTGVRDVPLVYDPFTGEYVAEHRAQEQIDDEVSRDKARQSEEEIEFLHKAGFQTTITD